MAGTQGMAVYSRRTRRWRLFGDATQEKGIRVRAQGGARAGSCCNVRLGGGGCKQPGGPAAGLLSVGSPGPAGLALSAHHLLIPRATLRPQVQGLMWLPGGVIAAVALVDGGRGEPAAPQLLLYPQSHLDSASLLARLPLQQVRELEEGSSAKKGPFK